MLKIYRNLHKNCWSLMDKKGKVIAHADKVYLFDGKFIVRPGGRASVLTKKKKVVHAFAAGYHTFWHDIPPEAKQVSYNPYKFPYFYYKENEEKIEKASKIWLTEKGTVFVG